MMLRTLRGIGFLILAALVSLPALAEEGGGSLGNHPAVVDAGSLLDVWIGEQMLHQGLPGLSVGVIHDQDLVWAKGYGFSDEAKGIPATPQTLYRIGSITKLFTSTAILQLRDQGKLRLDDPITRHLPWFRIKSPFEGAPEITVWHLLTHTSGLPREAAFPYWTDHVFPSIEEVKKALPEQQTVYVPGTRYKYSNLGMALLGEIVAVVSGKPWAEALAEQIFEPLGMTHSSGAPDADMLAKRAVPYMRRLADGSRGIFDYYDTGALGPAANMVSNLEDLARFAKLQLRSGIVNDGLKGKGDQVLGRQVLAASTLREMHRPHWVYDSWSGGRGLGFAISRRGETTVVSHGGWIGGNRCHLLLMPEEKIAVIAMTNADDGSPSFFAYQVYDVMASAIAKAVAETGARLDAKAGARPDVGEGAEPDPAWEAYVGVYTDPWAWEYRVMILDGALVMYDHGYPPSDKAANNLTPLAPLEDGSFRMPDGERVRFELGEDGKVKRLWRRYDYLLPVTPETGP